VDAFSANPQSTIEQGLVFHRTGRLDQAQVVYQAILDAEPTHFDALHFLGVVFHQKGDLVRALSFFDRAIAVFPDAAAVHSNRGLALAALRKLNAALASYERAIALDPDEALTHYNRGLVLQKLSQPEAAASSYEAAIALRPRFPEAHCDRGNALLQLDHVEAAIDSYRKAIDLDPSFVEGRMNLAKAYVHAKRLDDALRIYESVLDHQPDHAEASKSKAMVHLLRGQYGLGWRGYEARERCVTYHAAHRSFGEKRWTGQETVIGKTVLLHWEQGLGDTIQFCRYAKLVADLGAHVILEVQKPLLNLMQSLEGPAEVIAHGSALPPIDLHSPLGSLPLAFATAVDSIPAPRRYLQAAPEQVEQWREILGRKRRPRVGLAWRGNVSSWEHLRRQVPLSRLLDVLPSGLEFVALQREPSREDQELLEARTDVVAVGEKFDNFMDTAAVCEDLDLVVSVDTSVAHLSAALGRPTWILLPFSADWRWLQGRTDSPWYPTVKLYRQPSVGDWNSVLNLVAADLAVL